MIPGRSWEGFMEGDKGQIYRDASILSRTARVNS